MRLRALSSLVRAALALALPAVLAASCGGNVYVEDPPPECDAGLTSCGGACVDTSSDYQHCGGCDNICYEGYCSNGSCVSTQACPPNLTDCFGECVDMSSDPYNCGGCGTVCDAGYCDFGSCPTSECYCGGICQVIDLGSQVPQSATTYTDGLVDQWYPSCTAANGVDAAFLFHAPQDGVYDFDTFGSDVPTVLEVLDPGCGSYGCTGGSAVLTAKLGAGQEVLVVVDSQGLKGTLQLNISLDGVGGCATCNDVISTGDPGNGFCPGSEDLYNQLVNCICNEQCAMLCQLACQGDPLPPECEKCIYDEINGCGKDLNACLDDQ